jgi:hypothetical protein
MLLAVVAALAIPVDAGGLPVTSPGDRPTAGNADVS